MNCSISGEVPEEPVVSTKSGLLYEKRLIERHISDYGKCPVTGEALTMDDIVPVKTGKIVKPRSLTAASIPGMLGMFQNYNPASSEGTSYCCSIDKVQSPWGTFAWNYQSLLQYYSSQELQIDFSQYEHPVVLTIEAQAKYVGNVGGALSKNLFLKDK